ncbi:MAG: hypothetical protein RIS64_202 [Bacteroidota bacterium]|jgi:hypothetical protein
MKLLFDENNYSSSVLLSKRATFKAVTQPKKSVFLIMITTYGVEKNKYVHAMM